MLTFVPHKIKEDYRKVEFFRVNKELCNNEIYKDLSPTAILLYSLLCDRLSLTYTQELTNKIPNPLPQGTVTANKTGETSRIESDVAIVFSPKCDYIICVLTNDSPSGIEDIRHISKLTYDYFNS
jgi:hypothetical protein